MEEDSHRGIIELFSDRKKKRDEEKNLLIEELYRQIGQLKVELDWLKEFGFISEGETITHRAQK